MKDEAYYSLVSRSLEQMFQAAAELNHVCNIINAGAASNPLPVPMPVLKSVRTYLRGEHKRCSREAAMAVAGTS